MSSHKCQYCKIANERFFNINHNICKICVETRRQVRNEPEIYDDCSRRLECETCGEDKTLDNFDNFDDIEDSNMICKDCENKDFFDNPNLVRKDLQHKTHEYTNWIQKLQPNKEDTEILYAIFTTRSLPSYFSLKKKSKRHAFLEKWIIDMNFPNVETDNKIVSSVLGQLMITFL